MKINLLEMAMVAGAMYVVGYFVMKSNPDMMCKAKEIMKDTGKMISDKLEKED